MSAGWSQQYPATATITSVTYSADYMTLFVVFDYATISAYSNVPVSVQQAFAQTNNPLQVYNSLVKNTYHAIFLFETTNCPLILENNFWCAMLNEDKKVKIAAQTGPVLQYEFPACPLYDNRALVLWTK